MTFPIAIVRRLFTPIILVGPLMMLIAVPAIVYGVSSNRAVASADAALMGSLVSNGGYVTINASFVCPNAEVRPESLAFRHLDLAPKAHKTSLSSVGFDEAVVDLNGRNGRVLVATGLGGAAPTDNEKHDHITVELHQTRGNWCLYAVSAVDKA